MNIFKSIEEAIVYLSEAIGRIFSPNDDMYPIVGVHPFEGEPYQGPKWAD